MKYLFLLLCTVAAFCVLHAQDSSAFGNGEGVNGTVLAMVVQQDGKMVIGGTFVSVNGVPRQNLARLNADGTLDTGFIPQAAEGPNGPVAALALLKDGSIIAGGDFTSAGNLVRTDLVKFKPDGTADAHFGAMEGGVATNGSVSAIAVQPDGSIVVGGFFTVFYGQPRRSIARLNPDGTVAKGGMEFQSLNGHVSALALDAKGTVFAGGDFSTAERSSHGVARLSH